MEPLLQLKTFCLSPVNLHFASLFHQRVDRWLMQHRGGKFHHTSQKLHNFSLHNFSTCTPPHERKMINIHHLPSAYDICIFLCSFADLKLKSYSSSIGIQWLFSEASVLNSTTLCCKNWSVSQTTSAHACPWLLYMCTVYMVYISDLPHISEGRNEW